MELPADLTLFAFDLDGTLANFPIDYNSMREELRLFFSSDSDFSPIIREITNLSDNNPELVEQAYRIIDKFELRSVSKCAPIWKTIEMYKSTHSSEKNTVIITRNGRALVSEFLNFVNIPNPDLICSRDEVEILKPDISHFQYVIENIDAAPHRCLIIGDSYHDSELANNCGANFLHVDDIK